MKPENFEQVKELMGERKRLEDIKDIVEQSDTISFFKTGRGGRHNFDLPGIDVMFDEFKNSVGELYKEYIKEVDEKLKEL